jgi:hypothetical protein
MKTIEEIKEMAKEYVKGKYRFSINVPDTVIEESKLDFILGVITGQEGTLIYN